MLLKQIYKSHLSLRALPFVSLVLALLVNTLPVIVEPTVANATIAPYINFQGKLTKVSDGTNMTNGTYAFEFKLYDALTAGSLLWTETFDQASGACGKLTVTNAVFNAKLGSCNALTGIDFTTGSLYLTVNFAPTGTSYDGEMSPRKQLVAAPYAFVANGVSGTGTVNSTVSSATALTVAKAGTNYGLQVDTSTTSAVTGLKITSAAAASGLAMAVISSGTNENATFDAKGSGTISINGTATGDILLGGGSASTGCTITNSTGAFACAAGGTFTTLGLTGAATGATGYNGLVVTANTGVITTGTWNGTIITSAYGGTGNGFTKFSGPASSEKTFTLPNASATILTDNATVTVAQGGTGAASFTANGVLYGNTTSAFGVTAQGGANTVLVANAGAPSFSAAITVGTSVTSPTINATTALQLNGTSINTGGTLSNVAYLDQANAFTANQSITNATIANAAKLLTLTGTTTTSTSSGTAYGLYNSFTNANTSNADTSYSNYTTTADATALANTVYGDYQTIALSGNAAKTGVGNYATISTSSTTADTIIGSDIVTSVTGIMTTGTRNVYGARIQPAAGAASTGGTTNVYGSYVKAGGVVGAGGTINGYGLYIANGTYDTTGTSTNTGLYVESPTGADTNYAAIFAGGNVGIGVTAPAQKLAVAGNIDLNLNGSPTIGNNSFGANSITFANTGIITLSAPNALTTVGSTQSSGSADQTSFSVAGTISKSGTTAYTALLINPTLSTLGSGANYLFDAQGASSSRVVITTAGNVGIGDTSPAALLTVGSGDLFQVNSSGQVGILTAPASDYAVTLDGSTANDNSRIMSITQADDAAEDTYGVYLANTANPGSVASGTRNIRNQYSTLTPTISVAATSGLAIGSIYGTDQSIDLSNTTIGASTADDAQLITYGNNVTISGTPVINNTSAAGGNGLHQVYGTKNTVSLTPTLTAVTAVGGSYYGNYNSVNITSAGSAGYTVNVYGTNNSVGGNLTTTGTTAHYGDYVDVAGSADTNYGIYVNNVIGATNNYAAIFGGGNVGIGDTTPAALLTVGNGDLFQVNSSGAIAAAAGITSSGTITFSGLGGSGTKCIHTDNSGVLSAAAADCGTGSGTRLDQITAATTTASIDSTNNAIVWDWSTLTTQAALSLTASGTGLTTGSVLKVTSATTGAVNTNGIVSLQASGNYTSTGNNGLLDVLANSTTAGTVAKFSGTSLTTGTGVVMIGGTAMTTGKVLDINTTTYDHGNATETGSLMNLAFTDATTGTSTSTTNGLLVTPTINVTTGASGTKTINGIKIGAPTLTACTGGSTCVYSGLNVDTSGSLANTTIYSALFNGGNVGIGTTAPGYLLDINGSAHIVTALGVNTAPVALSNAALRVTNTDTTADSAAIRASRNSTTISGNNYVLIAEVSSASTTNIAGYFSASSGTNNYGLLVGNGNVGIGDTTPAALLTVGSGDLFQVNSSGAIAAVVGITNTGSYGQTGTGTFSTGTGAISLNGFTTISKTITADSGTTNNLEKITFTTPVDTTGTNTHQGLNIATTVGDASGGTNTANVIGIDAVTGDAQVTLNAINIGALTATAATEKAINVGSGWDTILSGTTAGTNLIGFTNFTVSSAGALTAVGLNSGTGLVQGTGGLTITGAAVNLNASSNFAVNIGTGSTNAAVTIGGNSNTVEVNSSNWDVSTAGAISGLTGYTQGSGNFAISGTGTFGTGTGAISLNGFTTIAKTITADTGTTNNLEKITFTTPADTTGTQTHQGLNIATTVGNASGGTNTANIIGIDALTGDAQVTLNGINIGALTGTAASESAIKIGDGWDTGITGATYTIDGTTALTIGAGGGTIAVNSSDWDISTVGTMTGIGAITMDGLLTGTAGATISGAAINLNASSNFGVNIATGTSTGAISIGNSAAGAVNITTNAASTFAFKSNTASALQVTDGTTTYLTLDTRTGTSGVAALNTAASAPTIASASTAYFNLASFTPGTVNFSGNTQITSTGTSANNAILFNQPTINRTAAASGLTIDQASNVFINGPTIATHATGGQTETITAASALRIGAGGALNGTNGAVTSGYGLYVDAPTGATNNYAAVLQGGNVGINQTAPDAKLDIVNATIANAKALVKLTGTTTTSTSSGTAYGLYNSFTNANTTNADTAYANYTTTADATALANTVYGNYQTIALSGNAAKTGVGNYATISTSSTTADTIIGTDIATSATGIISAGTRANYGIRTQPASTAANTSSGTEYMYGIYSAPSSTSAAGSTENIYGGYFKATGTVASGTVSTYGAYIANPSMNTTGTSSKYGLFVEDVTANAADNNYAAIFAGGNVGIGVTTPAAKLTLGNNVATGFLDNYSEYQLILYDGGTAGSSYGLGIKGNTMVFNSNSAYSFDGAGSSTKLYINGGTGVGVNATNPGTNSAGNAGVLDVYATGNNTAIAMHNGGTTEEASMYLAPGGGWYFDSTGNATASNNQFIFRTSNTNSDYNGVTRMVIASNGDTTIAGSGTTCVIGSGTGATNCTSDRRLKTNIIPITDPLAKLAQIQGVTFNWADPSRPQKQNIGVIAQDVAKAFPEAVGTVNAQFNGAYGDYYTVDYAALVSPLISGVNELNERTNTLFHKAGSGQLLQVQDKGVDRLMVADNGSLRVLGDVDCTPPTPLIRGGEIPGTCPVLSIKNKDASLFTITSTGDAIITGTLTVGVNTAGTAMVRAGDNQVTVTFNGPYASTPKIIVTPDDFVEYRVQQKSATGFVIQLKDPATTDTHFDWVALVQDQDTLYQSSSYSSGTGQAPSQSSLIVLNSNTGDSNQPSPLTPPPSEPSVPSSDPAAQPPSDDTGQVAGIGDAPPNPASSPPSDASPAPPPEPAPEPAPETPPTTPTDVPPANP